MRATCGAVSARRAYAAEELIAEFGAAFLCADLALTLEPLPDHAAYAGVVVEGCCGATSRRSSRRQTGCTRGRAGLIIGGMRGRSRPPDRSRDGTCRL